MAPTEERVRLVIQAINESSKEIKKIEGDLAGIGAAAKKTEEETAEASERGTNMTRRQYRMLMMSVKETTEVVAELGGKTNQTTQAMSQGVSVAMGFTSSVMQLGVAGAAIYGITTAVQFLSAKIKEAEENAKIAVAPYKEWEETFRKLEVASGSFAAKLQEQLRITKEQATALAQLAEADTRVMQSIKDRVQADSEMAAKGRELNTALVELERAQDAYNTATSAGINDLESYQDTVARATEKVRALREQLDGLWEARGKDINVMTAQDRLNRMVAASTRDDIFVSDYRRQQLAKEGEQYRTLQQQVTNAYTAMARAREQTLQSLVSAQLTPTAVSGEDQRRIELLARQAQIQKEINDLGGQYPGKQRQLESENESLQKQLASLGTYTDKWDEFRRRVEAVKAGTDPKKYGEAFAKQLAGLQGMGLSLDQVIAKFQNFSLFAGGANMQLLNFDSMAANVGEQLLGMAGKAEVTEKALAETWKKLTPQQLRALGKIGIGSLDDATKVMLGLQPSKFGIKPDDDFKSTLDGIRKTVLDTLPPELSMTVHVTYELGNEGTPGAPTKPSGKGVAPNAKAAPPKGKPTATPAGSKGGPTEYASGGFGTVTESGLVWLDKGEQFWASGTQGQVPASDAAKAGILPSGNVSNVTNNVAVNVPVQMIQNFDLYELARQVARTIQQSRG